MTLVLIITAYLASRRGSRDSQCSNASNVSNEDVGPLNFSAHPRLQQRRTSNFLELPGTVATNLPFRIKFIASENVCHYQSNFAVYSICVLITERLYKVIAMDNKFCRPWELSINRVEIFESNEILFCIFL